MRHDDVGGLNGCFFCSAAGAIAAVECFPNALAAEADVEAVVVGELMLGGFDALVSAELRERLEREGREGREG